MIICRKCRRRHPDSIGSGPCPCGADLRRDGVALVQSFDALPTTSGDDLDDLPPLDEAVPASAPVPPPPSPSTADPAAPPPPPPPAPPAMPPPPPPPSTTESPVAGLRGRARRARSVSPRDLLAAQEAADRPNVGDTPTEPAARPTVDQTGTGSSAAAATTTEPTPVTALQVAKPGAEPTTKPAPGTRPCPVCEEPNPQERRFCVTCAATLPTPEPIDEATEPEPGPPRRKLRDRLSRSGTRRGGRGANEVKRQARGHVPAGVRQHAQKAGTWRQRARAAGQGRMSYSSGLNPQTKIKAAMAAVAVLAGAAALLGPGRDRVAGWIGRDTPGTPPAAAALMIGTGGERDAAPEVAGFPAEHIHDEDRLTGAGIQWDADAEERPTLVLELAEPLDVRRVLLAPGLPDKAPEGPLVLRPSRIQICSDTGSCQELTLTDSTSLQSHSVSLGGTVSAIDLTVLDVHEPSHTTYPLAVIAEIRLAD